jgi:hypothetical protein
MSEHNSDTCLRLLYTTLKAPAKDQYQRHQPFRLPCIMSDTGYTGRAMETSPTFQAVKLPTASSSLAIIEELL